MSDTTPVSRLNYLGSLEPVIDRLCRAYSIGEPTSHSVIGIGYEDCNVIVETSIGKYVAKIFSKVRKPEDITRYSSTMEVIVEAGINHPPLITTVDGNVVHTDTQANDISMVLMQFIEGETFLSLNRSPNPDELKKVLEQAAKVNQVDYQPPYLFDSWAIPNIQVMFDNVKTFIDSADLSLVEKAMQRYSEIPVKSLPHCFVHGDFTKANVMKGSDGKIYILDFSVANVYPRIQELAVIAANLLHDSNYIPLGERCQLVLDEYSKFNPLREDERKYLYDYALAGVAMEFMGAHQEKHINGNTSEETEFWLNIGREGLRTELE